MIGVAVMTRNLVKRRGRNRALDGLTLSVPRGSVMGLVGANGAGKTTWMMTVAGFLRPDAGEIDLLGCGPFDARLHGGRFAILPQDSELPHEATAGSVLYRFGRLQGLSAGQAHRSAENALRAVNLVDRKHLGQVAAYLGREQQFGGVIVHVAFHAQELVETLHAADDAGL